MKTSSLLLLHLQLISNSINKSLQRGLIKLIDEVFLPEAAITAAANPVETEPVDKVVDEVGNRVVYDIGLMGFTVEGKDDLRLLS